MGHMIDQKGAATHLLEEETIHQLRKDLPPEWILREEHDNPAVTVSIELVEAGNVIRKKAVAHIRGEARAKIRNNALVVQIPVNELAPLEQCNLPALLIVHSSQLDQRVWIWVQKYINQELNRTKPQWREQKTVTIYLPVNRPISTSIPKLREILLNGTSSVFHRPWYSLPTFWEPNSLRKNIKEQIR